MRSFASFLLVFCSLVPLFSLSQSNVKFAEETFSGINFRSIGPAFMSGRIADIAIHPENENIWYVAVGSGGVWKTMNSGTTWTPVFDDQPSYSIGCVTIDKQNPDVIWVGTGENVGGRHVGYGDGIYKSKDGGITWQNMGLKTSEHISKIIVHPENSDVIWVAAQGPLWNKGGERGLYKTTDGGKTWQKQLGDDEWVGATDIVIHPENPDILYAATWQRHRNVAAYMANGPGTAIYKTTNGGNNWEKLTNGLPEENMGKIGLAISPQKPQVVYAAIELDRRKGGLYRTENSGGSWVKMSDAVSGATGPHYYQELEASPHAFDRIYLLDVRVQVSDDGGKTFRRMKEKHKHSDNHALAFRESDPNYLLIGTDGGLYESFDLAQHWKFVANLPVTQFYKLALDDSEPFYTIYGGTQDNNTQGGPSRTDNVHGIRNADWYITLFGDGHQPATEPGNPDIMYSEWQEGNLVRVDRTTGEIVYIQPQPREGEDYERFNWDAPILVSPHKPTRLYFASQRLWKSEDRGDSWEPISSDLTRNQERVKLPIMEKTRGWDAGWDLYAMSNYNTITSIDESPVQPGLIYVGTDDGIIQVTEDNGNNWRKIEVSELPDCPKTAFVNNVRTDLFDANTVYVILDNHKYGDFNPYIYKSENRGKSWKSIKSNLPDRTLLWRMAQDHVKSDLLFLASEFGIYFTVNGGEKWTKLTGNVPTISFRDMAIHKRENDLVGASFGRGFYVLDDYTLLREVSEEQLQQEATLFPVRDTWWYMPRKVLGGSEKAAQGSAYFTAPNPEFGALIDIYLKEDYLTDSKKRSQQEAELRKMNQNVVFPDWETLQKEKIQPEPKIWVAIQDQEGNTIRRVDAPTKKGFHRVAWDLRYPVNLVTELPKDEEDESAGFMAPPGKYTATLFKEIDGLVTALSEPVKFNVVKLRDGALDAAAPDEVVAFWQKASDATQKARALHATLDKNEEKMERIGYAIEQSRTAPGTLDEQWDKLYKELLSIIYDLEGNPAKQEVGEKTAPTVFDRLGAVATGTSMSTYGPTPTHKATLELAEKELKNLYSRTQQLLNTDMPAFEAELKSNNVPWVIGQPLPE